MSTSSFKFILLFALICVFSFVSYAPLNSQIKGYILEEEDFGLASNQFATVSDNINGNIYILDSDRKKVWVHNIEDNTTTNIVTSESTLFIGNFVHFEGATFFTMSCETGYAVIQTQNTFSSTKMILQIPDVSGEGGGLEFIVFNEQLYISQNRENKIYKLDNPMSEVQLFVDMKVYGESEFDWTIRRDFFVVDSHLFFTGLQDGNEVLWSTNGSVSGLEMLKKENGDIIENFKYPLFFNNTFYFSIDDNIKETWVYDSSDKAVKFFDDFELTTSFQVPVPFNGGLVLRLDDDQNGTEPWFFDGTNSGTYMLRNIDPNGNSYPTNFAASNGKVIFSAENSERWETDGTANGTKHVGTLNLNTQIQQMGNRYFEMRARGNDEIVLSEYLGNGVLNDIKEIPGALSTLGIGRPYFTVIFEDFFFFYSRDYGEDSYENWYSDGSSVNTNPLDNTFNFGRIRKKMEIEDRVLVAISTSSNKSSYYNVKKEDATLEMATIIDDSSQDNFDLCFQVISTNTENELEDDNSINLFPSPAYKYVTISSESGDRISIEILDSQGRLVISDASFKQVHTISLENTIPGIYFAHITKENTDMTIIKRFVKQ